MTKETIKPVRKDARRNREHLLSTARTLLEVRGVAFTLNELAREAEVGVGTVYRHFSNKDALLQTLLEQPLQEAYSIVEEANRHPASLALFRETVLAVCTHLIKNRAIAQVLFSSTTTDFQDHQQKVFDKFQTLLDRLHQTEDPGVREDFSITDLPPIFVLTSFISTITHPEHPQLWQRYATILIDGILSAPVPDAPAPLTEAELAAVLNREQSRIIALLQG